MAALIFLAAWTVLALASGIAIGHVLCERDERVDAEAWRESRRYRAALRRASCGPRAEPDPRGARLARR